MIFAAANGYHLFGAAARLIGAYALLDATKCDPVALNALIAEHEPTHGH